MFNCKTAKIFLQETYPSVEFMSVSKICNYYLVIFASKFASVQKRINSIEVDQAKHPIPYLKISTEDLAISLQEIEDNEPFLQDYTKFKLPLPTPNYSYMLDFLTYIYPDIDIDIVFGGRNWINFSKNGKHIRQEFVYSDYARLDLEIPFQLLDYNSFNLIFWEKTTRDTVKQLDELLYCTK